MADIYENNDFHHVGDQKQFKAGKTPEPSGHQWCDEDDESDADYENIEHTLEMKETSQTPERRRQDNSEKGTEELKSSTTAAFSIILLYVLLLMVTLGWVGFITVVFIKYSALTEEIQHLRMSHITLKENMSQLSSSLNSSSSQLQAQECIKVCPCDWILFSGSCYYYSKESRNWSRAQEYCVNQASSLAIINNVDELIYLRQKLPSNHWVGLSDRNTEGSWKWVDGRLVDMSDKYWNAGEPNNVKDEDCGELTDRKINDRSCSSDIPWICEKRA
ncbi:CD209 antigen-like protein E [Lepisosteus oculatus]|uniref:CD209 antigen-like protein E n=1 Tax=Lepisosteus oculatus TaxID=7918 RepID=UPI0035F51FC2